VSGWMQVRGTVHVLPAHRRAEQGTYLWIDAGELHEALRAELFLPAVPPEDLDGAMGVGVGAFETSRGGSMGDVRLEFGRVDDGGGVMSLQGPGVDADVRFELRRQPPSGGFCAFCGTALEVGAVDVITPPDGGVMGMSSSRCAACGDA
jgi:hypothetical protein